MAIKSSLVSTPTGDDFARATLTLMLLSNALKCYNLFSISFCDCLKEINLFNISTL